MIYSPVLNATPCCASFINCAWLVYSTIVIDIKFFTIIVNLNNDDWVYFQMSLDPELAEKTFDKLSDMEKAFHPPCN